jgi:hypothetical protein
MADDKSRKQATLGYVRDSQLTIGCVDGRFAAEIIRGSSVPHSPEPRMTGLANILRRAIVGDSSAQMRAPIKHQRNRRHWHSVERGKNLLVMLPLSLQMLKMEPSRLLVPNPMG